jgi:peroxiredoxin
MRKVKVYFAVMLLFACISSLGRLEAQESFPEYSFKFKIKGLKDTVAYLGFHMGEKKYVRDTCRVNSKGEVEFTHLTRQGATDILKGGIYLFVLPNMQWFEFVVAEPSLYIETDTANFVDNALIKGSLENTLWFDYLRFVSKIQKKVQPMQNQLNAMEKEDPARSGLEATLKEENKAMVDYRKNIMSKYPKAFVSSIFRAMEEPEIPEDILAKAQSKENENGPYWYLRNHYFDRFDLTDSRILRTPIFEPKLTYYFEKLLPQLADSLIPEAISLIKKVEGNPEMFKFVVHSLTYMFERSNIMCMDKAFVQMVNMYYKSGKAVWLDTATLNKVIERATKLEPLLCKERVPNIILPDTGGTWHNLYAQNYDYTVLYFWDATCGHCKKTTPKLESVYQEFLKPNGIGLFTVEGEVDTKEWKKFIREHNLTFISVSDNPEIREKPEQVVPSKTDLNSLNFRNIYDLSSYPVVYVLDKDKTVIAKKLGVEQLQDFLEKRLELDKKGR